ncbi:MAG: HEPN domain-containing protein [Rectinemataceae bacterium]|jgi:HEPN domain-containing protein
MKSRARDWLRQAEEELAWAKDAYNVKRWASVCFTAQQVAEKSLKAIALARGALQVKSHSAREIAKTLDIDGELEEKARILDQYYITTRYPDAFATGAPFEYFVERQASDALEFALAFVDRARTEIEVRE